MDAALLLTASLLFLAWISGSEAPLAEASAPARESGASTLARAEDPASFRAPSAQAGGAPRKEAEPPHGGPPPAKPGPDLGMAPPFMLPDIRGGVVDSGYESRPVTVVHFWASWCVPCLREVPELNGLAARYGESGVALFSVALDSGTTTEIRQIAKAYDMRHTVLVGNEATARGFGGIPSFPMAFLVDERGRILERFQGASPENRKRLERAVRGLLLASGRQPPP